MTKAGVYPNVVVLSVDQYLSKGGVTVAEQPLVIPSYQRPYRWSVEHVGNLLSDIRHHRQRLGHVLGAPRRPESCYRLGTIVLHENEQTENGVVSTEIVDGQQRTLTLLLILRAAAESSKLCEQLQPGSRVSMELPSDSVTSRNLFTNLKQIRRVLESAEFTAGLLDFLLHHCELVVVKLNKLSEAFQFFDSQNSRGLDLQPHDLLKAFHLRAFPDNQGKEKKRAVARWQRHSTNDLKQLFAHRLYPIRRWSRGGKAIAFSKADIGEFQGVSFVETSQPRYPYQQAFRLLSQTVDRYNKSGDREFDGREISYPFQITQTIINGRRFFEWVQHYQLMSAPLSYKDLEQPTERTADGLNQNWLARGLQFNPQAPEVVKNTTDSVSAQAIFETLNGSRSGYSYPGKNRAGDRYVRRMFDAAVLSYYDRFGEAQLNQAVIHCFVWAYTLRLSQGTVFVQSVERYIRENNLLVRIQEALLPVDVFRRQVGSLHESKSSNVAGLEQLFAKLGYLQIKDR